jgi:hypothetical protein
MGEKHRHDMKSPYAWLGTLKRPWEWDPITYSKSPLCYSPNIVIERVKLGRHKGQQLVMTKRMPRKGLPFRDVGDALVIQ